MKILLTTELAIQFSDNEDLVKIMNMPQKENSSFERSYITADTSQKTVREFYCNLHGFSFFHAQVKMFTGSVRALLTSVSLK